MEKKRLQHLSLKQLAELAHQYEDADNDVDFIKVMDEVGRRKLLTQFRDVYMEVWRENMGRQRT